MGTMPKRRAAIKCASHQAYLYFSVHPGLQTCHMLAQGAAPVMRRPHLLKLYFPQRWETRQLGSNRRVTLLHLVLTRRRLREKKGVRSVQLCRDHPCEEDSATRGGMDLSFGFLVHFDRAVGFRTNVQRMHTMKEKGVLQTAWNHSSRLASIFVKKHVGQLLR